MHPILASRLLVALSALAWAALGVLLAALLSVMGPRGLVESLLLGLPIGALFGMISLSAWFVCRSAPAGRASGRRMAVSLIAAAVAASFLGTLAAAGWARGLEWLTSSGTRPLADWLASAGAGLVERLSRREIGTLFTAGAILYLVSAVFHYLLAAMEASREAERHALQARVAAREAELRALRAQLDPHFLFNSLNTISSLAGSRPDAARRACVLLSEFLRASLKLGAKPAVPLGEEIALARAYLEVERVRFGERLAVSERIADEARACLVPALLLQPLVENAVGHGVSRMAEGGTIVIEARREGDRLLLAVENPCDPDAPGARGNGIGLSNVRARLDALGGGAQLQIHRTSQAYRVELTLAAVEDARSSAQSAAGGASPRSAAAGAAAAAAGAPTGGGPRAA